MKPNILFIMTDQHRADCLGCYGNNIIETPNLDWVASEGCVFTKAYTPSPSCIPARASLISGMTPWNTGILGMGGGQKPMGTGFPHTLPGELAMAGYHTQGVGKMHFSPQRALNGFHNTVLDESGRSESRGFVSDYKVWFDRNKTGDYDIIDHGIGWNSWMARPYHAPEFLHQTNWTVNESINFLNRRDPTRPFFLYTSFSRPHSPYTPPAYYYDMYINKRLPEPFIGDWAKMHDVPAEAAKPDAWRGVMNSEVIHRARAAYYGSVTHIDHQTGRLLQYLKDNKLMSNTIIIFTSDHGDMLGDHNLWRKTYAYEGSARIPLIIRMPKEYGEVRSRINKVVSIEDIMPTLLEAVGVDIPATVDGKSLLGLLSGSDIGREYIHGEHSTCYSGEQEMQFLTDGKIKYIWFPRLGTEQLFNTVDDPGELHDLAGDAGWQDVLLMWRSRMVRELEPRNLGLTDGDKLVCQSGKPPIISPKYEERVKSISG